MVVDGTTIAMAMVIVVVVSAYAHQYQPNVHLCVTAVFSSDTCAAEGAEIVNCIGCYPFDRKNLIRSNVLSIIYENNILL